MRIALNKPILAIAAIFLIYSFAPAFGQDAGLISVAVFYTEQCRSCHWLVEEYIPKLKQEFGERVRFEYYDVSIQENSQKRMRMQEEFGVGHINKVPQILVKGRALVGRGEIQDKLKQIIEQAVKERARQETRI